MTISDILLAIERQWDAVRSPNATMNWPKMETILRCILRLDNKVANSVFKLKLMDDTLAAFTGRGYELKQDNPNKY